MGLTDKDFRALAKEGDLVNYVRTQGKLQLSRRNSPELTISCSWCSASPNNPCTNKTTGREMGSFHEARTKALIPAPPPPGPGEHAPKGTPPWRTS